MAKQNSLDILTNGYLLRKLVADRDAEIQALVAKWRRALTNIQEMAATELDEKPPSESLIWQIEADAREALATPTQAIVDKRPKPPETADGVPVTPGMVTWCDHRSPFEHHWDLRLRTGESYIDHLSRDNERHYSTRTAVPPPNA